MQPDTSVLAILPLLEGNRTLGPTSTGKYPTNNDVIFESETQHSIRSCNKCKDSAFSVSKND